MSSLISYSNISIFKLISFTFIPTLRMSMIEDDLKRKKNKEAEKQKEKEKRY